MTSPLLRLATHLLITPLLVLAAYLFWRGHDAPGGGFIAALVAGVALSLRALTVPGGRRLRFPPAGALLGAGLLLALSTVALPLALGDPLMTAYDTHVHPFGLDVHLSTSLVFDAGVASVVVGLLRGMLDALQSAHDDPEGRDDETAAEVRP